MRELAEHFRFASGIVLPKVSVYERRMNPRWRDAITTNVAREVILRHRIGHRNHRAFASRISKAVGQARGACDGGHIENHAAAVRFHMFHGSEHAVIEALHIHFEDAVEISLCRCFEFADMGDPGIVHQGVDSATPGERLKRGSYLFLICNIAFVCGRLAARFRNFPDRFVRLCRSNIDYADTGTACCEAERDSATDATGAARDDYRFPVKPEAIRIESGVLQRETPRFHGMKSFCASNSALVCISPLATCTTRSRISSPISSIVVLPRMMSPALTSMMSGIRWASAELVEIFTTGAMGLPVGVPSPVVKSTTLAPAATCAVTHSTSLPGVH